MKNVLLVNPFGIGDVLFATPLIGALKKSGVSRLDIILGSRTAGVLSRNPDVDEIVSIDKDELKNLSRAKVLSYLFRLLVKLRLRRYDTLIDLSLTREYAFWAAAVLGIKRRVGFNFKRRGTFLTERIDLPDGFSGKHVIEFYRDLASLLSLVPDETGLRWYGDPAEEQSASEKAARAGLDLTQPYLVVAPGGGSSWGKDAHFKQWAPEKFARLLSFLGAECSVKNVLAVGSVSEKELTARVKETCSLHVIDLAGQFSLGETAGLIQKGICFVGNDGGLLHLAKAVGCPTVSIFGPVDPKVYGPYPRMSSDVVVYDTELSCRPCYRKFRYKADCEHRACLTELSVDEVIRQIKEKPMLSILKSGHYETAR